MTPPPTTTTRAWAGMLAGVELAVVTGSGCPSQKRDLGIILRMALMVLAPHGATVDRAFAPVNPGRPVGAWKRDKFSDLLRTTGPVGG
jgi:hypothetical protein